MQAVAEPEKITIPYKFTPRDYQLPLYRAMDTGKKRGVIVWHRRAGKEKSCLNYVVKKALERVGSYYYFFPTAVQGRKVLWDGIDKDGFKFLDHIPAEIRDGDPNQTDMKQKLINGSIIQVVGSDKFDAVRGTNPVGCVFSEYSYQNPKAWETFRPILKENGGWAIFNFTPQGNNHAKKLYDMAKDNPKWFSNLLTVEHTLRADGTRVITDEDIEEERREGMPEEMIQQEYYCSFTGVMIGSYYGKEIERIEKGGQITRVPWESILPVDTWWDLGIDDQTAIWFTQTHPGGKEIRVIDYYANSGEGLAHYAKVLKEKPYAYGKHGAPHDIEVREFTTGKSRKESAHSLGIDFIVVPSGTTQFVTEGIEAVRNILPKCYFDKEKCKDGLEGLKNYRKQWDDKLRCFQNHPHHDWASNPADAFRHFAIGHEFPGPMVRPVTVQRAQSYAVR